MLMHDLVVAISSEFPGLLIYTALSVYLFVLVLSVRAVQQKLISQ